MICFVFFFAAEPPAKFMNKNDNKKITAHENESVTLCAVVSSERANVRWLRGDQLLNQDNIHISSEGKTHKLTINPLQLFDSGEYVCDVITDRMSFSLLVKGNEFSCIKCIFFNMPGDNLSTISCLDSNRNEGKIPQTTGEHRLPQGRQPHTPL